MGVVSNKGGFGGTRASGPRPKAQDPIERARNAPKSRSLAIRAKCYDCEGRGSDPCWQWRVGNCHITDCPLWLHRPYQGMAGRPVPASLAEVGGMFKPLPGGKP